MHVLVVGGTGMVGGNVIEKLLGSGHEVTVSSRRNDPEGLPRGVKAVQWDARSPFPHEGPFEAVVSVTGASLIDNRWTPAYKEELRRSRIEVNRHLRQWIRDAGSPPKVFVSASAVGYYGRSPPTTVIEESPPGDDFLARLCADWEKETMKTESAKTRCVVLRQGVVMDRRGDALQKMLPFFRMGLGGPVGTGRQPVSWISSHDLARLYLAALEDDRYEGPVNAVSPSNDTNRDLTKALGHVLHRPAVFPVPPVMLQALYGEAATTITEGQSVVPQAAKKLGFTWDHPTLETALEHALGEKRPEDARREQEITRSA